MFPKLSALFILFCLYGTTYCQAEPDSEDTEEENQVRIDYALKYVFIFCGVILVIIIRHIVQENDLPIPHSVFSIILGFAWGFGSLYNDWMYRMSKFSYTIVEALDHLYLPIILFRTAFCIDVHAFFKSLTQILIISGPIALLSGVITGIVMKLVIDPSGWRTIDGLLFGLMLMPIYSTDVLQFLKESTIHTKHVKILLEGEILITAWGATTIFILLSSYLTGWKIWWYQFIMHVVRQMGLGIPMSYLIGVCGSYMMKAVYNDPAGIMLLTVVISYTTYFYMSWFGNAGVLSLCIVGILMGSKRSSLSQEIDKTITTLWTTIHSIATGVLFINVGVVTPHLVGQNLAIKEYILVLVTYLVSNVARFLSFFVFSLVLSRVGYGMTFQNMMLCVWAGLKNPLCLDLALYLHEVFPKTVNKVEIFYLHSAAVYVLMLFINGSCATVLIKALGLSELSSSRQMNMNNCMKYIYDARARTIAILKMDRFLADANWPLVMKATALRHPYKKKSHDQVVKDREEDEEFLLGRMYTFCPDCQKHIPNEPTPKELREMTKEAKMRVLKLKKTAYSRLFENGMMSKVGIRILHQAVEVAMDSKELVIELDGLIRLFSKEGIFYRVLRNVMQHFLKVKYTNLRPPRKWSRLLCYDLVIVHQDTFLLIMNSVVLFHAIVIIYQLTCTWKYCISYLTAVYTTFACTLVYGIELFLKVLALSWILVLTHGVRNYFRSYWNIVEFTILCFCCFCLVLYILVLVEVVDPVSGYVFEVILTTLLIVRLLRMFSFLKYCECCRAFTPSMIRYLEAQIDSHRALAYELGKNYLAGEEEILENLHQIVDNEKIREVIKKRIDSDRLAITRKLGIAQKESPHVATTVKTKLAMQTVLNSMKDDVHELKVAGWVDDVENTKLLKCLGERYSFISSMKTIQPVPSKLIFREVPYMGDENELIEFLYTNVNTRKFNEGEIVYREGNVAGSIYVLISGMLKVTYTPEERCLMDLRNFGALPVVDYVFSMTYEEPICEFVVPGNSIGELSLLTERDYDGVVTAETTSTVYVLTKATLKKAFEMDVDPVNGLECRLWKFVSFKKALTIMMNTPSYRSYTQDKIKYVLERSFVPNLSNYKIFVVNEMIADVILIEGVVIDFNSRDMYTGPCYIPRAVQKLVLSASCYMNVSVPVETKLLIIPAKDHDEYEIMVTEEEICELVNDDSSKCLRHLIQEKGLLDNKNSRVARHMTRLIRGIRQKFLGSDSVRSKRSNISSGSSKVSKIWSTLRVRSGTRV